MWNVLKSRYHMCSQKILNLFQQVNWWDLQTENIFAYKLLNNKKSDGDYFSKTISLFIFKAINKFNNKL